MSGDVPTGRDSGLSRHLSDDQLNAFLDHQMAPDEQQIAADHLADCASCQESLDQFLVLSTLLGELPQYPVPRSFQLSEVQAGSRQSLLDRLASWMLPALPVMRTATLVLVLALGGVSLARVMQNDSGNEPSPNVAMLAPESTSTTQPTQDVATAESGTDNDVQGDEMPPTNTAPPAAQETGGTDQSRATASEAPVDNAAADEVSAASSAGDSNPEDEDDNLAMESEQMPEESDAESADMSSAAESSDDVSMMKAPEGTPATPEASPTAITASPSPVASPHATPEPVPSDQAIAGGDDQWPWRPMQIALIGLIGLLVVGMAVTVRGKRASSG